MGLWNTNEALPGKYKTTIDLPYNDSFSTLTVFIGVELEGKNIFPTHNIWYHPISKATNYDMYENVQAMLEGKDMSRLMWFISFPDSKMNPDATKHAI